MPDKSAPRYLPDLRGYRDSTRAATPGTLADGEVNGRPHSAAEAVSAVNILPNIDALIADTELEILSVIEQVEDERTSALYDMVRYHMGLDRDGARGKRIRPLLGLLVYHSLTGDHRPAVPGAAAVELGHNFSLVHDDIEDRDVERRHRATLWTVFGVPHAINAGDLLFPLSRMALYRLLNLGFSDATVLSIMRLYDETCVALCEGQFMDIWSAEHDHRMSVDYYFDMIGRKTAALIAASAQAGAMLATDDQRVIESYRGFGWSLGIAFQLNDDLLGIWGEEEATGKEPSDLAKHKKTLPVIYALEHAAEDDRARLRDILAIHDVPAPLIAEARDILERCGAREYTRSRARAERDEALARLETAGVVNAGALERLRLIIVSAISA